MAYKPILFNTEMVQAIQAGRKTQTRRLIKCNDGSPFEPGRGFTEKYSNKKNAKEQPCRPGDILWVRETWQHVYNFDDSDQAIDGTGRYIYFADNPMPFDYWVDTDTGAHKEQMPWKPSIHMPKEAARIFLRVKDVRIARLREMDSQDGLAEGIIPAYEGTTICVIDKFIDLWDSTIKPADRDVYGWYANPWVWVIEFERVEKPKGW